MGIAVAIGQWLIAPDHLDYQIRFALIILAILMFLGGSVLVLHAGFTWSRSRNERPVQDALFGDANVSNLHVSTAQKSQQNATKTIRDSIMRQKRKVLLGLREEGVALHNQRIFNPSEYHPWVQRFEDWHVKILKAAEDVDPELRAMLSPLRNVQQWNKGWAISVDHRLAQNMIWETLERLEKYLGITG